MKAARAAAAPFTLAALMLCGDLASADPPSPSGAAATQIGQAGVAQSDTTADQLPGHTPTARAVTAASQLTAPSAHAGALPQITRSAVGRDTRVGVVAGHDRCDPASPDAKSADCARIPENRPQDFQAGDTDATANTVDPNAPSKDLVNGILSSGTGTVVQLPK